MPAIFISPEIFWCFAEHFLVPVLRLNRLACPVSEIPTALVFLRTQHSHWFFFTSILIGFSSLLAPSLVLLSHWCHWCFFLSHHRPWCIFFLTTITGASSFSPPSLVHLLSHRHHWCFFLTCITGASFSPPSLMLLWFWHSHWCSFQPNTFIIFCNSNPYCYYFHSRTHTLIYPFTNVISSKPNTFIGVSFTSVPLSVLLSHHSLVFLQSHHIHWCFFPS